MFLEGVMMTTYLLHAIRLSLEDNRSLRRPFDLSVRTCQLPCRFGSLLGRHSRTVKLPVALVASPCTSILVLIA